MVLERSRASCLDVTEIAFHLSDAGPYGVKARAKERKSCCMNSDRSGTILVSCPEVNGAVWRLRRLAKVRRLKWHNPVASPFTISLQTNRPERLLDHPAAKVVAVAMVVVVTAVVGGDPLVLMEIAVLTVFPPPTVTITVA